MHRKILNTLFQGTADQACEHIFSLYEKKGYSIVDYLYFANIAGKNLFEQYAISYSVKQCTEALLNDYKAMNIRGVQSIYQQAILDADIVLPDGIALQLYYFFAKKKRLHNLNGTDFCPYFLSYAKVRSGEKKVNLILYGTYPHLLEKTKKFLLEQEYNVVYAQDGYTNLDWENIDLALKGRDKDINILLVARTTPEYPIQEIWSFSNKESIKKHGLLVFNQGGTFDFWVGEQKRAPKLVRSLKLEWLRRLFADPKRNIKKVVSTLAILRYIFVYLLLKKH